MGETVRTLEEKQKMANEETKLTRCSFQMMFSFWSDLFNFTAGIGLFHLGSTHILIATGYLIFHLASLLYLMLFKKLGFKYHLKTTRLLILAPQLFLFIPAIIVRAENRYLDHQLIVLCKSELSLVSFGLWLVSSWSLLQNIVTVPKLFLPIMINLRREKL